jgi:hypothetical protein
MATKQVRTVDFLPEIFQTPVNQQFLNATLDQLVQEPAYKTTQGYIGQRVGPGVNPSDAYVIEPTQTRNDYQLEPGVVTVDPTTLKVRDAITYPGIIDAVKLQGGITNRADRLFESEYYTWDPFVDFDKYINYSQYYWLPESPLPVIVSATTIPTEQTFTVTRTSSGYTFSGVSGTNPTLTLARDGNYFFEIAQNNAVAVEYRVTVKGTSSWQINYQSNPTLTLTRGNTYTFDLTLTNGKQFYIKTAETYGTTNVYSNGVLNNGADDGLITFTVPQDAPDTLYYVEPTEFNLRGQFNIVDAIPGDGPEFWIQTQPGVNGRLPWSPNISSRDVLGVINNGIDLGTVQFNVPGKTAQDFYFNMPVIAGVDLIVPPTLQYDQINGISVEQFFANNPNGIDGITNLNYRTLVFATQSASVAAGGWYNQSGYDPLAQLPANNNLPGSFDSIPYADTTEVSDPNIQFGVWQVQYVTNANGVPFIQLNPYLQVNNLTQFTVTFGTQYANTQWYKNAQGFYQQMPLLTANLTNLYYQDGTDPLKFGVINLVDQGDDAVIDINDILGQPNYTAPNGVVFTNGLVVSFSGNVFPETYLDNTYYVEGVGTGIKLLLTNNFVTPEPYVRGVSIPYDSTLYDETPYDGELSQPLDPNYATINRASADLNPWTRANRWFHIDVINYAASLNQVAPNFINAQRAKRPILEFRAGTRLFDFGTEGIPAISLIDFETTDALSTVNGAESYTVDGYALQQNNLVIFAADTDPDVRNQVYTVNFIVPEPEVSLTPIIDLVPTSYSPVKADQTTVCILGVTTTGVSYYYTGTEWIPAQQKTANYQAPLFDVYDSTGRSFGDTTAYPSTNFTGCALLSYAENPDNSLDPILGIPLDYFSLDNIGDIVFTNNLYVDTFVYTPVSAGVVVDVSSGFVREYQDRITFTREIGWQTGNTLTLPRQQFRYIYDGTPLQLDITVSPSTVVPSVQIFINNQYQDPTTFIVGINTATNTTMVTLTGTGYVNGDIIEMLVLSDQVSNQGFYQVPTNLQNNPFNVNSPNFTLGSARNHYQTICQNLLTLEGPINGPNNTRDLGNIIPYGQQIVQQSSPLTLGGFFLRSKEYNIFAAIEFNSREYIKFKSKLLTTVTQMDLTGDMTIPQILDLAITEINKGLTSNNSFYWSDMLPAGSNYTSNVTVINPITLPTFNLLQTYDFTSSNYLGLLVYLNGDLLLRGTDYTVSPDAPKLTILVPLAVGDVVTINEYPTTLGNFVPNTPTKMGLYPKYRPEIYLDTTYSEPTPVIRGHDGSITIAWSDIRDEILLEFEKRIYDNIKVDNNPIPISTEQVNPDFYPGTTTGLLPGFFRKTPYTFDEINTILGEDFLTWVGQNRVDYQTQDYQANNPFSYNYSQGGNRINGAVLQQANWRGMYRYFYDTETPNMTPWEMVGFSEEPAWWVTRYGPAPYTSGNMVLWDDMEAGLVADPIGAYVLTEYARPGLSKIIPSSDEGDLLPPVQTIVGLYDPTDLNLPWSTGDGGPVEASWWKSSSYPYAIMRLLAVTKPAEFFSLFADRDLYRYNTNLGQYLYNGRYRLDAKALSIYGNGTSKASYINWIVDYNQQMGVNSTASLQAALNNIDVRLCYRMAAFSDKQYISLFTERSGPGSTNDSLQIPPESYDVLFYKNEPFKELVYSAVVVEVVAGGYAVYGYSNVNPYFTIQVSSSVGKYQTIVSGGVSVSVPSQYTQNTVNIPYGQVFTNTAEVVDFLLSYGVYLTTNGLIFDTIENGYTMNWNQMAQEFLYFSSQGWVESTLINLNPAATTLKANQPISIIDTIASLTPENMLLDQYRFVLDARTLVINRDGTEFSVTTTTGQTISFLTLRFTNYEDVVVVNNTSEFNDLIYDPATGLRQSRLSILAFTSTEWDGQLDAKGFILNLNNIEEWEQFKKYTKGDMVLYKNTYWSAQDIVQPKQEFDYTDWRKSDYQLIDEGLLPNLATKADQLANTYDIYQANLVADNDLFAFGLIGFRPRQYMSNLNLNFNTQVQLYQQFLGTKGTRLAAEAFTFANIGKESGDYQIYENWAILAGTYGAQANKSFFEIALNEADLKYNPSTVQIIQPGQTSEANQQIYLSNIWKESYKLTSTNIMPTTYTDTGLNTGLPTAGYVSLDDVDINVFSIDDPSAIEQNIDTVGVGTYIWIAKINSYNWGVFRAVNTPGQLSQVSDNLDGTSVATFTKKHGLTTGDLIIIKYFNQGINGVYRVLSAPSPVTILISYAFTNTDITSVTGQGLVFKLESARVSQASNIATLSYVNRLIPGEKVWIDNNGDGLWEVVEKTAPFVKSFTIVPGVDTAAQYGVSVAQADGAIAMLIGAPGNNDVYPYIRSPQGNYNASEPLTLTTAGASGFGNFVSIGNRTWALAGASTSNSGAGYASVIYRDSALNQFILSQLLLEPNQNYSAIGFGTAGSVSYDERWMYVSAPGVNNVYAYALQSIQPQTVSYETDGETITFNYANTIQIDPAYPGQLTVTLDDRELRAGVDFTFTPVSAPTSISFGSAPRAGQKLVLTRTAAVELNHTTYYAVQENTSSGFGDGAVFTVENTNGRYKVLLAAPGMNYAVGETITISYTKVSPTGNASNNLTVTVTAINMFGMIEGFTSSGAGNIPTTYILEDYLYTATSISSFTIRVNDQPYRANIDYTFDAATTQLTFLTVPPLGAEILVTSASNWQYVATLTVPGIASDANFGVSVETTTDGRQIFVGANLAESAGVIQAGTVYVFDRSVIAYTVTNASQLTYAIPSPATAPISVMVNNTFLTNTANDINGQYTVVGNNVVLESSVSLTIGDTISIDTNQFTLMQQINPSTPTYQAKFGSAIDSCPLNCSVYVGAPFDSTYIPQAGSVDHQVNQSRVYGVTTSTVANPALIPGNSIRVNDIVVVVPDVPNNTAAGLTAAINAAGIPNVTAATTTDLIFTGDGETQSFNIGNLYSDAASYTPVVYINNNLQTLNTNYTYNPSTEQISFLIAPAPASTIRVVSGRITISVINSAAATPQNMLTVLPNSGTAFATLGFNTFVLTQQIVSPAPSVYAQFGASISVDSSAANLIIGAPNGNVYEPTTFDAGLTYFDERSTTVFNPVLNAGVAYTYDFLPSGLRSINSPGQFAFGQQIYNDRVITGDEFAAGVNYTSGRLVVGAPGGMATSGVQNLAYATVLDNPTNTPAWAPIRIQQPVVDVDLINSVFTYDRRLNSTQTYFDFFDPLQGKVLGSAQRNIDYIGAVDPADYNTGPVHNNGNSWESEHVGRIWWDTDTVRFIDPNQDNIVYASRRWGQTFPGSRIDIYTWIESTVPPAQYTGTGTPLSNLSFTTSSRLGSNNVVVVTYFFWVRGLTTINEGAGKTLPPTAIASYILDPRSSGLPYIAALNASTIAIYNAGSLLSAENTIMSIGFDRELNDDAVHQEYNLIAQGRADAFLNDNLYRKLQDSLCGQDTQGAAVPDPTLPIAEQFGVQFRPRQSMFANRFTALKNYLTHANKVLAQYPITETRRFNLLNQSEPVPPANSGAWNAEVPNLEILYYQDLQYIPAGYLYLVLSDSSQQGRWTIYVVVNTNGTKTLMLNNVQSYDTPLYWYYVNWYQPGYNKTITPVAAVPLYEGLAKLSYTVAPVGSSVRVLNNGQGKFEIYQRTSVDPIMGWVRVGLEDGTIAFREELWDYAVGGFGFDTEVFDAQYFSEAPNTETRYIIQALNEEIYVDELLIERNKSLILMFNYAYTEFSNPEWLLMTSLVDVDHKLRGLEPYQAYIKDNQTFVLDYFNEVKPYHVQVRQFNLIYAGQDTFEGTLADFDLPAFYDYALEQPQYVSPVLLPYTQAQSLRRSTASDTEPDAQIWLEQPWIEWYNNYLLGIDSVQVVRGGSGYTVPPVVTVTGTCTEQAVMTSIIDSTGQVVGITVVSPGAGYSSTAIITITGGNGTGAVAVALMGNSLVRSIKTTIKYDRYQYVQTIAEWQANVDYPNGTLVRYRNTVWGANGTSGSVDTPTFNATDWLVVDASTLSGVDRTMGYYVSTVNQPGLSLPLLIDGIDYPGVQVQGPLFSDDTGYDRSAFDVYVFDNYEISPEGVPTYDKRLLDAEYSSAYLDLYLGTRATDINVDGGAYVDTFSSHAPEELVPGAVFDTLDLRVYTRPVSIYAGDGVDNTFAAPAGSVAVTVTVNNVVIAPTLYTYNGVNVVFNVIPAAGVEIVILETDPESAGLAFRVFQDMRGVQADYRITPDTTTAATVAVAQNDDVIEVDNIGALSTPDFAANIWGVVTINGERIMYRDIDILNNTISGLLRGTGGTAAAAHDAGSIVYNMSRVNLLPAQYENYYVTNTTLANGTQTVFTASNINLDYQDAQGFSSTPFDQGLVTGEPDSFDYGIGDPTLQLQVFVAGARVLSGYTVTQLNPAVITFATAPPAGVEVTMLVYRGVTWYEPGVGDPSNGVPLQDQQTTPARFFRGY